MRSILYGAIVLSWFGVWVGECGADEQQARAIVERAIEAGGGQEKLSAYKGATWTEEGMYYGGGDGVPYTGRYAMQYQDKFRMEITDVFAIVLNGDAGWIRVQGQTQPMSAEDVAETKEQTYAGWVTTLVPLQDKRFTLETIGEVTVNGRPAAGVKVSSKDHRDVKLYFDKENHLLVKSEGTVKSDELGGKEVREEVTYSDYRTVDGIKTPMKMQIQRDGQKYVQSEITELKNLKSVDEKHFSKPE